MSVRKLVAGVEIAGGFLGMALASGSATGPGMSLLQRILTGAIGIPFGLCAYAGRALWLNEPRGYLLSILVQAAQVPTWSSPSLFYLFYCGGQLGAWFGKTDTSLMWGLGSRYTFYWLERPRGEALGINFLALLLMIYLALDWLTASKLGRASSGSGRPIWFRVKQSVPGSS